MLEIFADDPAATLDFAHFCETTGHALVTSEADDQGVLHFLIRVEPPRDKRVITAMLLIRSLVFNVLFYGMTAVMVVVGLPLLLLLQRVVIVYANIWAWGLRLLLKIVGISHRISGPMPEGQVIYAAKHQSAWETVILYQEFGNPAPVLKRELLFLPVMGFYSGACRRCRLTAVPQQGAAYVDGGFPPDNR